MRSVLDHEVGRTAPEQVQAVCIAATLGNSWHGAHPKQEGDGRTCFYMFSYPHYYMGTHDLAGFHEPTCKGKPGEFIVGKEYSIEVSYVTYEESVREPKQRQYGEHVLVRAGKHTVSEHGWMG